MNTARKERKLWKGLDYRKCGGCGSKDDLKPIDVVEFDDHVVMAMICGKCVDSMNRLTKGS